MPSAVAVVDTGPLFAAADERDEDHKAALAALARSDLRVVIPGPVATETAQMIAERLDTPLVLTLDHRHFAAVKPAHCDALRLLPE